MKKLKYKTIDISTLKGIKAAEKLQSKEWKIMSTGFYTIQFYKMV
jgi:hypothetical protein